jgi:hypothetical protein
VKRILLEHLPIADSDTISAQLTFATIAFHVVIGHEGVNTFAVVELVSVQVEQTINCAFC